MNDLIEDKSNMKLMLKFVNINTFMQMQIDIDIGKILTFGIKYIIIIFK